jgi:hypothetical protein
MTDDRLNKLGNYFVHFQIGQRFNISFERFVQLVQDGMWSDVVR